MTKIRLAPATAESWPQLGRVFGPRQKDPTSCWCQRSLRHEEPDNRSALRREVHERQVPIGLLVYRDDDVVGWTPVVPRSTLPGVMENRALARILNDDPDAWWVSCFVVRREHHGSDVGGTLLEAAANWATQHGASVLDGHPVDNEGLAGPPSAAAICTGTLGMFQRAGLAEIGRTYRTRPVMRRNILHR